MRFDSSTPTHCLVSRSCSFEPLVLNNRITRSPNITVTFTGWEDPTPTGGTSSHASGIEHYVVTLHHVTDNNDTLKVQHKSVVSRTTTKTMVSLTLPVSDRPHLFAVVLEIKDIADNVDHARRFVLLDNSSYITLNTAKPLRIDSANPNTNYKWQIHHGNVTLSWENRFYNNHFLHTNLLKQIDPDADYRGVYEQSSGPLPVSGTANVHGIIRVKYAIKKVPFPQQHTYLKDEHFTDVPQFLKQKLNLSPAVQDGDSYQIWIKNIDVFNNTYTDSVVVHIDKSPAEISDLWILRDSIESLFVHNTTDLSKMTMQVKVRDPHSGIHHVKWRIGTVMNGNDIGNGTLPVRRQNGVSKIHYTDTGISINLK